jgi:ribonuclease P protein subunit RPR2
MVRIARDRIDQLLALARERAMVRDEKYSRRYVQMALRLGTRYNVRLPVEVKRWLCKGCWSYLVPGLNARVRTGGRVVVTCLACGRVVRLQRSRGRVRDARSSPAGGRVQEDSGQALDAAREDAEDEEPDDEPD